MNARGRLGRLLLAAVLLTSLAARADEPQRCAALADDRSRLACYDSIFGRPDATVPGPVGAPALAAPATAGAIAGTVAAAPAAATAANPEADFGLTEAAKRAREPEESRLPESISGTVAKVARQPTGEFVLTLENGQVWTQVQVDARARVAVGETVTIKKAALGSHLLVTEGRYATRVRRLK